MDHQEQNPSIVVFVRRFSRRDGIGTGFFLNPVYENAFYGSCIATTE